MWGVKYDQILYGSGSWGYIWRVSSFEWFGRWNDLA